MITNKKYLKKGTRLIVILFLFCVITTMLSMCHFAYATNDETQNIGSSLLNNRVIYFLENLTGCDIRTLLVIISVSLLTIFALGFAFSLYRQTNYDYYEEEMEIENMERLEPELEPLDRGKTIDLFFQAQEEMIQEKRKSTKGKHF